MKTIAQIIKEAKDSPRSRQVASMLLQAGFSTVHLHTDPRKVNVVRDQQHAPNKLDQRKLELIAHVVSVWTVIAEELPKRAGVAAEVALRSIEEILAADADKLFKRRR